MGTVEVVVKLSEDDYKYLKEFEWAIRDIEKGQGAHKIFGAILNGIVLPKGHGKLFILDEELANKFFASFSFSCQKWISEVGISNATLKVIEADKGEVKPNMQKPWKGVQPPCFDNCNCHHYEIGEGGCAICTYDAERIIEDESCHKYKTRGR